MREQCYGPQDLALGAFIHVYGRDFFIHDADDFTKQWYSVRLPKMATPLPSCMAVAACNGIQLLHHDSHCKHPMHKAAAMQVKSAGQTLCADAAGAREQCHACM